MAINTTIIGTPGYLLVNRYDSDLDYGFIDGELSDFTFTDLDGTNIEASCSKGIITFAYDEFVISNAEAGVTVSNAQNGIDLINVYLNGLIASQSVSYNKIVDLTEVKAWNPSMALTTLGDRFVVTSIKMLVFKNTTRFDAGNVGVYNGATLLLDCTAAMQNPLVDKAIWMGMELGSDADLTIQSDNLATAGDDYVSLIITYNLLT